MRVSAKADYAVRAMVELAAAGEGPVKGERIAQAQEIPINFLENIMADLRNAGLVRSRRGVDGGYWLGRPAEEITIADVIRAVDGPLAAVRGVRPEGVAYGGVGRASGRGVDRRPGEPAAGPRGRHPGRRRPRGAADGREGAHGASRGLAFPLAGTSCDQGWRPARWPGLHWHVHGGDDCDENQAEFMGRVPARALGDHAPAQRRPAGRARADPQRLRGAAHPLAVPRAGACAASTSPRRSS